MVALNSIKNILYVNKFARVIVQGPTLLNKMGNPISKSYSPQRQTQQQPSPPRTSFSTSSKQAVSQKNSDSEYVEAVVCKKDDMKDNEMKVVEVGNGSVLLVKQKGEFSAVGTKCTHYGAPLVDGALGDGRVRCPWHGACFNTKTGDIEDFPVSDPLPCYKVSVTKTGEVKVRARKADLETNRRTISVGPSCRTTSANDESVVIIGGGYSGATCAETLRNEGYNGRIVIIAKENYLPYDRLKVSKLGLATDMDTVQTRPEEYYAKANIEVIKGTAATKVNTDECLVYLNNDKTIRYNNLYIATGSKPRTPDIPGIKLGNIFTVRDFDDSINILSALGSKKDKNVVVLGLSFIGLEIAASGIDKAASMTVVGKDSLPLGQVFGNEIGRGLRKLFEDKGVNFVFNTTIKKCNGENGKIQSVELENGTTLPADILVLGVGSTFYTDFLRDSGVEMDPNGAVSVNDRLETNVKHVYAGGDIAKAPVYISGNNKASIGHVGLAQYHGKIAALNILQKDVPLKAVPYFWTYIFGKSIRYTGHGRPSSTLIDGDVDALKFVIYFFDESDKVIAVASSDRDPVVSQFAEFLYQGKTIYKKDLENDRYAWINQLYSK